MPNTKIFNLDEGVMDYNGDRYDMVVLSSIWAKKLRKNEDFRNTPHAAVIRAAMTQILSGEVTKEEIMKVAQELHIEDVAREEEKNKRIKSPAKPKDMALELAD